MYQAFVKRLHAWVSGANKFFSWFPIALAAIAGVLALFYKHKADKAEADNIESETRIQDAPLVAQQAENAAKLERVNEDIKKIHEEREKLRNQYITDQEKADSWDKK